MIFRNAWRHLRAGKVYTVINVLGLAAGMAVALLIGLWITDELTFDHYHKDHARLAEAMYVQTVNGARSTSGEVPIPLRAALEQASGAGFEKMALTSHQMPFVMGTGDRKVSGTGMFVEPGFPSMFSLRLLEGSAGALQDPSSVLLSRSMAKALFGNGDALGKTVNISGRIDLKVAAVYDDLPPNTTFTTVGILASLDKFLKVAGMEDVKTKWGNRSFFLYALLHPGADANKISEGLRHLPGQHVEGSTDETFLYPMDRWHLYGDFTDGKPDGGRIRYVWLFGLTGIFVLLLACINFMNLSTARSAKRAKEVGIRKTMGALRGQLVGQFLGESVLLSLLASAAAMLMAALTLPFFNDLSGKQMQLPADQPVFWIVVLVFVLFTGLLSGCYPAFYLSGFRPIRVLKGILKVGPSARIPRRILVTVQFTVSVALIAGTLVVLKQVRYAEERPVGYSRAGLITLTMYDNDGFRNYAALRDALLKTGMVAGMTESSSPSTHIWNNYGDLDWRGKDPRTGAMFGMVAVTHDFGRTLGWEIRQGRDFSRSFATDTGAFILNETAAKLTGFTHPVGEIMHWEGKDRVITGVVKDLVMESPFMPVKPTVFFLDYSSWLGFVTIRLQPNVSVHDALAAIKPVFQQYQPGSPFEYEFVDDTYAAKFSDEQRLGQLAGIFAVLAVFISCLGLFGLASFMAEQRTKEVCVRKVLGASVFRIWRHLSGEFLALVCISCGTAVPVAWYFLDRWLQHYTYRTPLHWWLFAEACGAALLITLVTVSVQTVKAAWVNPADSLRTE
ncbi:ABC transporter permease [Dinghuibacter silviterrae]|uniref:ABC-type antimicrobial peptide transport system permease subunit n=1 Tax=Dinghuibacter silviterrae TaxID=1539049 RepID=A0A4R8DK46_9BACT|nr:ABC transporter permease [Dinghuibacter silviterrae]TDW97380.1 ABC-type antimicrobial peptide transport system permease subunit [Dinghuibacter silviterrae]